MIPAIPSKTVGQRVKSVVRPLRRTLPLFWSSREELNGHSEADGQRLDIVIQVDRGVENITVTLVGRISGIDALSAHHR